MTILGASPAPGKETHGMLSSIELQEISDRIRALKQAALELQALGSELPCLHRNTARILASVKMLEIGFCDPADPGPGD
jgi:hypothetical protein